MTPEPVIVADKFALFSEPWSPKRVGRVDGHDVRVVRLQGEFHWHCHADADEIVRIARANGRIDDPVIRQRLVQAHAGFHDVRQEIVHVDRRAPAFTTILATGRK